MTFVPFALVEWQSRHEAASKYCLADSGCRPARPSDLVDGRDEIERLLAVELSYGAIAGADALRSLVADWQHARAADVLVTVGGTEANAIVIDALVEPGAHAVVVTPGYPQLTGCLINRGARVDTVALDPDLGWRLDPERIARAVRPDTRLIAVTNPNNPTGAILCESEMAALVAAAERVGAWLLVDEVHRGTEVHAGGVTPTFWGRYDRVACVGSMSKAFGLPGLRTGWLVAPPELRERAERRHEYATIATSKLAAHLAERALTVPTRQRLLDRTRALVREGGAALRAWVDASGGLLSLVEPQATAVGFVRYHFERKSLEVADALRKQGGVLVIPGAHFGVEGYLRLTHGVELSYLTPALERISSVLGGLRDRV
jgi:aspartate/methionine/tyrosine aminotransferase